MTSARQGIVPTFTIGDRLRKARELTGLERGQFADELGIARNTVTNYEHGKVTPRQVVVRSWALRAGVDFAWIWTGEPGPDGGNWWAPRGSNPQPTDYKFAVQGDVVEFPRDRTAAA